MTDLDWEYSQLLEGMKAAPAPSPVVVTGSAAFASVWVALAVYTKAVQVSSVVAATPMTGGRQGIFNRPKTTVTEEQLNCEILGVAASEEIAGMFVESHRFDHPQLGAEYRVEEHPVGRPEKRADPAPVDSKCVGCGTRLAGPVVWCEPCRQNLWASRGWTPDSKDEQ